MAGDFNQWLQDLVSDAVSVTPPPPELDGRVAPLAARRPWLGWAMGGAAAAAVIGIAVALAVTSGDDENVTTAPVTDVATTSTVAASSTVSVSTTAAPTTASPSTTIAPTTTLAPVVPPSVPTFQVEPAPSVVSAGADGVWVTAGTERVQWVTEPIGRAVLLADGLIVQRPTPYDVFEATPGDTELYRVASPGAALEPLFPDVDWGGEEEQFLVLHDAAVIEGVTTVLVETSVVRVTPESPPSRLVAVTLAGDTPELREVSGEFAGWESGSSRLDLATNGLIVGEYYSEVVSSLVTFSVGSTDAPSAATLGIEPEYVDCAECPRLYSVSDDGTTLAWIEGGRLVRHDLTTGDRRPDVELGDLAVTASGLDVTDGAVAVEDYRPDEPAVLVTFATAAPRRTLLSAISAGFGPDLWITPIGAAPDFPIGVQVDLLGGSFSEADLTALLLGEVSRQVAAQPDGCTDAPRTITRLDIDTIRVRIGCDDSGGGIDYRIEQVTVDGQVAHAGVLRRTLCLRGVSGDLCV